MNFVTSVFKKFINKNDAKQTTQEKSIPDGTVKSTTNVAEVHKRDEIKNAPTSQRPTQNHPRIFEEDEPFEDAQTNPEIASMGLHIKGPITHFQRSSSIQPDSLNTSMVDSLEITIPEISAAISTLEENIEKSQDFLKPNDDFEEYQSLSPMIVVDSQCTPVSLSDILKPKSVESSKSSLEVLIRQVNKTLAIDEAMESKEIEVLSANNVKEESQEIPSAKRETSGPQSMDDLIIKLATCSLQDKINDTSEELNQKTETIEDRLDVLTNHKVPSLRYITSAAIKESEDYLNTTKKQTNLEAPIHTQYGDTPDNIKVILVEQTQKEDSIEKNSHNLEKTNFKITKSDESHKQDKNIGQITKDSQKLNEESSECDNESLSAESSYYKTENKEETASNICTSIETNKIILPVPVQNGDLEVNRNSIVEFETLEQQCTEKIANEQYIASTKQSSGEIQGQHKVLVNECQEVQNYNKLGCADVNGDSINKDLHEPNAIIYMRQETLEFERLERQFTENSEVQQKEKSLEGIVAEGIGTIHFKPEEQIDNVYRHKSQKTFQRVEKELTESLKVQVNNILDDIIEESQQKVIQKLALDEDVEAIEAKRVQNNPTNISYTTQDRPDFEKSKHQFVEYSNCEHSNKINDIVEEFVVVSILSQNPNEVQIDQHEIYSRQETLEYEKLEKQLDEMSSKDTSDNNVLENVALENIGESQKSEAVGNIDKSENFKTVEEKLLQEDLIKPLNFNNYPSNFACNTQEQIEFKKIENNGNITKINDILEVLVAESAGNNIEPSQNNHLNLIEEVEIDQHGVYKRQETLEFEKLEKKFEESSSTQKIDNILEEIIAESCAPSHSNHKMAENESKHKPLETINQETFETDALKGPNKGEHPSMPVSHTKIDIDEKDTLKDVPIESITDANKDLCLNISNIDNTSQKLGSPKKFVNKVEVRPNIRNKSKSTVSIELVKPKEKKVENDELRSKVDLLQEELDSIKKRERNRKPESGNNKDVVNKYRKLLEEYENHIKQQTKDLEQLKMESEINVRHFTNTEMAFSDVFEKYEKAKGVIAVYKRNEETLSENLTHSGEQLYQLEVKCSTMKQQSLEYIQKANEQIEQERRRYHQDIGKLHAQVKRLEIKASSLEVALKQKTDECQALAALCDDITGRSST